MLIGDRDYVTDEPDVRAATIDATITMAEPVPFAFGHRLGDDMVLLVLAPQSR